MGTNYYLQSEPPCKLCGHKKDDKHIGKSSCGWCFALHVYPDEGINDLFDWQRVWHGKIIIDEYGKIVSEEDILKIITIRHSDKTNWDEKPYGYHSWDDFHRDNHSQQGPNGLVRSKIQGHCIGHGAGAWDLIDGEFS